MTAGLRLAESPREWVAVAAPGLRAGERARSVLLAVPDPLLRRLLADRLCASVPGSILPAATLDEAERVAAEHGPGDLAVVDVALQGEDPDAVVRFVQNLRRAGWDHVVACGDGVRLESVGAVLKAGARGFLVGADHVPDTERPGPTTPDTPLSRIGVTDATGRERELSGHEVQILQLAADGMGNAEIGHVLGLSALTVKSHLDCIVQRLSAKDRAHLVLLALRSGAIR